MDSQASSLPVGSDHSSRAHSLLGGSTASIWLNCPGSVFHTRLMPPQAQTVHTELGTKAHEVAETVLNQFLNHKLYGTGFDMALATSVDSELFEAAQGYTEAIWLNLLEGSITEKAFGIEEQFFISQELDMGGTVDFWCVYVDSRGKRVLGVCDFKYGFHPVSPEKNEQFIFYATAVRKMLQSMGKDIDYARLAVYQPRIDDGVPYKESKLTGKQLDTWEKKFFKAAETIFVKKKATFKVGKHCKWCRAKSVCALYARDLQSKTSLQLVDPNPLQLPEPPRLPDSIIKNIVLNYDNIKEWIDACFAYALNRGLNGSPIGGLKIVSGASRRKWGSDTEQIVSNLKEYGLSEVLDYKLKGITEVEKKLVSVFGKEKARDILSAHTVTSVPSPTVVTEEDPRPALKSGVDLLS